MQESALTTGPDQTAADAASDGDATDGPAITPPSAAVDHGAPAFDGLTGNDAEPASGKPEASTPAGGSDDPARRYPTNAELHAIRQVRPITADDLGPGPFAGGFTLEEELEFQNYVPEPYIITEERRQELKKEALKYAAEMAAEFGEPTPEDWRAAREFWDRVTNRDTPETPL